jgi:signal transduction histidine kinase
LALGLAIVTAIVDGHQGKIWLESEPGQGTMFAVELPAASPVVGLAALVAISAI